MAGANLFSIFVYGTLKRGQYNNCLLKNSKFKGTALTNDKYLLYDCGFPLAFKSEEGLPIIGDTYDVDEEVLATLDDLEGHPHWYERHERDVLQMYDLITEETRWVYEIRKKPPDSVSLCPIYTTSQGVKYYRWK